MLGRKQAVPNALKYTRQTHNWLETMHKSAVLFTIQIFKLL